MSTLMICPTCGGVKTTATGAAVGRRCSCTAAGGTATATATLGTTGTGTTASSSVAMKVCSVCGTDVTDKKRMKDSATGRYWCYDCYVAEQRKKANGMTMRCPKCGKDYPPVKMMKHGEAYWCESCHETGNSKSKKKTQTPAPAAAAAPRGIVEVSRKPARESDDGDQKKKPMLYIVGAVLAVAAAAYYYFFMMPPAP
jgi:hypothetical protein